MRIAALAGLLAAATGCNQIFGLDQPIKVDAAIPPDAAPRTILLTWQVARTSEDGVKITYPALTPKPTIKVGPLPGQTIPDAPDWQPGELRTVDIDDQGGINVPEPLRGRNFRIVYRLDGETIDREVHWAVAEGHLVVERFGPIERTPPPPMASYLVPSPALGSFATFMTTGVWAQFPGVPATNATRGVFSSARSMSGPLGVPDGEPGYRIALCSRTNGITTSCAVTQAGPLVANGDAAPATPPPFDMSTTTTSVGGLPTTLPNQRMFQAMKTPTSNGLYRSGAGHPIDPSFEIGLLPTLEMASFTDEPATHQTISDYARPVMFTLASFSSQTVINYVEPMLGLPHVVWVGFNNDRTVGTQGAVAVSSMQALFPLTSDVVVSLPAPLATAYKLGATALDSDQQPLTVPPGTVELTWNNDTGAADLYEVTLYEILGDTFERLHVWTVFDTQVAIDSALFVAGKTYIFEITARTGMAKARSNGDFTMPSYPAGRASLFAGSFCVAPGPCP